MRLFSRFLVFLLSVFIILCLISCKLNLSGYREFYLLIVYSNGSFYKASPDGNIIGEIGKEINSSINDLHLTAVSPDKKKVLFLASLNNGRDDLIIVDGNSVINLTKGVKDKILSYDYKALFSPDSKKIAFTTIHSLDEERRNQLYIVNSDGTGMKNLTEGLEGKVNYYPSSPAFSPDGSKVLFEFHPSNSEDSQLWIVNSDGIGRKNLTEGMEGEVWPPFIFSPNGSKVLFEFHPSNSEDSQLWIVNSDGIGRKNLTEGIKGYVFNCLEWSPFFSPDGEKVIFGFEPYYDSKNLQLHIINSDGTNRKNLTEGLEGKVNYYPSSPAFSPDGKKVLFIFRKEGLNPKRPIPLPGEELWIVNLESNDRKNIIKDMKGKVWLSYFSPDGSKVLFEFHPSNSEDSQLWIVNSDGTNKINLTEGMEGQIHFNSAGGPHFFPFSPDGKIIIFGFTPSNSKTNQLWVINYNETERKNLTEGMEGAGWFTSFTSDGKKIIFSVYVGFDNSQLWIVNSDGIGRKNLTEGMEGEVWISSSSSFSPDGKRIITTFEPKDSVNSFYYEYWLINLENNEKKKIEINKSSEVTEQHKIEDLIWLLY